MRNLIDKVNQFGDKFLDFEGEDAEKVKEALAVGKRAVDVASSLLGALQSGDKQAFQAQLTEWEDVNRTYVAIGKMENAIEDAKAGVQLKEVLEGIGAVLKVAITIGALVV